MATFYLHDGDGGIHFRYRKPIQIDITGAGFTYDLDGPNHQEVFPVKDKDLEVQFPGIKRILREAHVRYVFERFGVPYVVSIQCYDQPIASRYLSCKEADPVAVKFLKMLRTAGGTPQQIAEPHLDLNQPTAKSDFTYFSPGFLIPGSGWRKMPGRADYHVYARMRSPIANRARLREVTILHALGRLLPHRPQRAARPQGQRIFLQGQRHSAGVR